MAPKGGMVDYMLIDIARSKMKGSIIAKVIGVGEMTEGTSEKGAWKKQIATLQDASGTQSLTLWNTDVGKLDQGKHYKIENPYWSTYQEQPQLSLGKYAKLHLTEEAAMLDSAGQTALTQTTHPAANMEKAPPPQPVKIPAISPQLKEFVLSEDILLLQIGDTIEANHKNLGIPINGQKIGLHVKTIYEQARKTNLIKASNL